MAHPSPFAPTSTYPPYTYTYAYIHTHIRPTRPSLALVQIVASAIVDKYIGESARLIREMFGYARDHQPCVIFMDEIDAIGGSRMGEGSSADREIQRTLMELLNQLDGFEALGQVKCVMATNRPDILDPALLRPGRLDRKIEIPLPNEASRLDIVKIHAAPLAKRGDIDYDAIVKLSDGFNGADLRNVMTEGGIYAIRAERDYVVEDDLLKVRRRVCVGGVEGGREGGVEGGARNDNEMRRNRALLVGGRSAASWQSTKPVDSFRDTRQA